MRFLLPIFLAICLASPAFAAYKGSDGAKTGGFSGPVSGSQANNVADALKLSDDARVTLTGKIVSKLAGSKDEYIFKDDTGEIQVKIKPKAFGGLDITDTTNIRISGKMDKDFAEKPEIDVKHIEIVK